MIKILCGFLMLSLPVMADNMTQSKQDAKSFGKIGISQALDGMQNFQIEDISPTNEVNFDADDAASKIKDQNFGDTEIENFIGSESVQRNIRDKRFSENEYFISRVDDIALGNILSFDDLEEFTIEKCQESAGPYPISFLRELQVEMSYAPEERKEVQVCRGHSIKSHFREREHAEKWGEEQKTQILSKDNTIEKCRCHTYRSKNDSKYTCRVTWNHFHDAVTCDYFKKREVVVKPERWEEKEELWIYNDESKFALSRTPDCSLVEKTCLDAEPRIIQGTTVNKKCWKEKLSYLCEFPKTKDCLFLRQRNCLEVTRQCVHDTPYGCALWEITYKCTDKKGRGVNQQDGNEVFGLNEENWETEYEVNQSFPDVYTKLSLFDEIKNQLESQNVSDASKVRLFKGKMMDCSKNIADHLLYDCCFSFSGLANDIKLSKCTENELTLGEMREKGLCHYIGKYEERFLDLWKSKDVHVFCCFPTKLARVFQEEARDQLDLDWGKPKEPNCRGLYMREIEQIDFSKINLCEVYDQHTEELEKKFQDKLRSVENRLKERIEV